MRSPLAVLVLPLLLCAGCGDDEGASGTGHGATEPREPRHRDPVTPPEPPEPRAPERRPIEIAEGPDGGAVLVDRGAAGGRVTLSPSSHAWLSSMAPFELVIARGRAHAVLPPAGNVDRPPLRIGTPSGTVEIGGSGEVWLEVAPDGRAWVAALGGLATVVAGGAGEGEGAPDETPLPAGRAASMSPGGTAQIADGPTRIDETEAAAREALAGSGDGVSPEARAAAMGELVGAVSDLESARERGATLAERQRAAPPEQARTIQRDIVAHSQRLHRLRRALLARWERARAIAGSGPAPDDLSSSAPRVARALGLDAPGEERAIP